MRLLTPVLRRLACHFLLATCVASPASATDRPEWSWLADRTLLQIPSAFGAQGPPPPITPALFHKFQMLLAGYHAVGGDARFTFAEWLVLNGVTEPREFFCMMWLWRSHCAAKHAA